MLGLLTEDPVALDEELAEDEMHEVEVGMDEVLLLRGEVDVGVLQF